MDITESITTSASPDAVWAVLVDLAGYERWNPFIVSASGTVAVGNRFTARFRPPGTRGSTLKPRFTSVEPGRRLAWKGSVLVPGVFDGAHEFALTPTAEGGTEIVQSETFGGVLVPLFRSTIEKSREGFRQLNTALAAEALAGSHR